MTIMLAIWSLIEPFKEWIVGGLGILGTLWLARNSGKNAERAKQQKERGDAYEQSLKELGDAAAAGRGRLPDPANDKYNRDRQGR